jgi:Bordetella pertussis Bvg accessory factor family.
MSQTTLCFDFGNTRLKCGVMNGEELQEVLVLENVSTETIRRLVKKYQPAKSILSSVINHNAEIETVLSSATRFHRLDYRSRIPVTTPVGKPQDIGADRLALVVAAVHLFTRKK